MPVYKNIPVDEETYEMLVAVAEANGRKQGAQVKALVTPEFEKLGKKKLPHTGELKTKSGKDEEVKAS